MQRLELKALPAILTLLQLGLVVAPGAAAELRPQTAAAFERYAAATERRITTEVNNGPFIHADGLPSAERQRALEELRRGALYIERLTTREGTGRIDIPDGMIHHWVGAVFVPRATANQAVALLQDYDKSATVYAPSILRSRLLARESDRFHVYLRFSMTKIITVVLDTEHEARFFHPAPDRAHSRIVSTKINEVEQPGTRNERLKPVGRDGGYLWRLNTYWRFLERDGGVYVQCESISLTRSIPPGLGWLIGRFVTAIPRESLTFTLERTRHALGDQSSLAGFSGSRTYIDRGIPPKSSDARNNTRNTMNSTFAIPAAVPAIPPKPRTAAINATTRKIRAQLNIEHLQSLETSTAFRRPAMGRR